MFKTSLLCSGTRMHLRYCQVNPHPVQRERCLSMSEENKHNDADLGGV